jgi:ParB/RepB/Spo0J family partition protein
MTTMLLDPSQVMANPYQTRLTEDAEHIAALAESIREVGLLQTPLARLTPEGRVAQLAFGHSRLAAWKIAKPGEAFPLEIRALSDRQMSDLAAEENSRRKNLTAIETARAIQRRIDDFGLTQLEAGKPFGYQSQGAVSNLLRLLKLPEPVQASVAAGELPERHARALINVARIDPAKAEEMTRAYQKKNADGNEPNIEDWVSNYFDNKGKPIEKMWPLDWQPKGVNFAHEGETLPAPACQGCEFLVRGRWQTLCIRPACHSVKLKAWAVKCTEAAAKKLGVATAATGEKTLVIYNGKWEHTEQGEKLLKAKPAHLRLVPWASGSGDGWRRERDFGSPYVALATVDAEFAKKVEAERKKKAERQASQYTYDPQKAEAERAANTRTAKVCATLVANAAYHLAQVLPSNKVLLSMLDAAMDHDYRGEIDKIELYAKGVDAQQRERVMRSLLYENADGVDAWPQRPDKVRESLATIAGQLKQRLPVGWDELPKELQLKAAPVPNGNGHKSPGVGVSTGKKPRRAKLAVR